MTPPIAIAAAQTIPIAGNVAANVEAHVRLGQFAASKGARLVVFPELSLTGYELERSHDLAFRMGDARLNPIVAAARRLSLTMIVGAPVKIGPQVHIAAFIADPKGQVTLYTKHHLGGDEDRYFYASSRSPLVNVGGKKGAVAICADANHDSHVAEAADRGAHLYLTSMFLMPHEVEGKTERLRGYARKHRMVVLFANYGGPTAGSEAGGRSAIWSEDGELLAQCDPEGASVAIAIRRGEGWDAAAYPYSHSIVAGGFELTS